MRFKYSTTGSSQNEFDSLPRIPLTLTHQDHALEVVGLVDSGAMVNVLSYEAGLKRFLEAVAYFAGVRLWASKRMSDRFPSTSSDLCLQKMDAFVFLRATLLVMELPSPTYRVCEAKWPNVRCSLRQNTHHPKTAIAAPIPARFSAAGGRAANARAIVARTAPHHF